MIILACNSGWSARVITSFDIAGWYLNSDLVIICTVSKIDTMSIVSYDSLHTNNERIQYDLIQESYYVVVDSIIRNSKKEKKTINQILSPSFRINYFHSKELERNFSHIDSKGDSIYTCYMEGVMDYSDNSYFRLGLGIKSVAILSETGDGFIIDYATEYDESFMKMINEIELKDAPDIIFKPEE